MLAGKSTELPSYDAVLDEAVADQAPVNKPKRKKKGKGVKLDDFFNAGSPAANAQQSMTGPACGKSMADVVKYGNIKMGTGDGGVQTFAGCQNIFKRALRASARCVESELKHGALVYHCCANVSTATCRCIYIICSYVITPQAHNSSGPTLAL